MDTDRNRAVIFTSDDTAIKKSTGPDFTMCETLNT